MGLSDDGYSFCTMYQYDLLLSAHLLSQHLKYLPAYAQAISRHFRAFDVLHSTTSGFRAHAMVCHLQLPIGWSIHVSTRRSSLRVTPPPLQTTFTHSTPYNSGTRTVPSRIPQREPFTTLQASNCISSSSYVQQNLVPAILVRPTHIPSSLAQYLILPPARCRLYPSRI
jgi:hypothetical protein